MTGCSMGSKPFPWQSASAGFVWTCDINVPDRPCFPTRQGWFCPRSCICMWGKQGTMPIKAGTSPVPPYPPQSPPIPKFISGEDIYHVSPPHSTSAPALDTPLLETHRFLSLTFSGKVRFRHLQCKYMLHFWLGRCLVLPSAKSKFHVVVVGLMHPSQYLGFWELCSCGTASLRCVF